MKIVFLDVDGVLNYRGCGSYYGSVYFVAKEKIQLLAEIIYATDAKIVLTSTWRYGAMDLALGTESFEADLYVALTGALEEYGLEIYDYTGEDKEIRGLEIESWIAGAEKKPETFVILDDLDAGQFGQYGNSLVQTDFWTGLEEYHAELAIQMLNEKSEEPRADIVWE